MSETNYFAAFLHNADMTALRLVNPERDLSESWRRVYDWIVSFYRDNGQLPKPLTVAGTWSIALPRPPEAAEVYARLVVQTAKRAKLEEGLAADVVPHLEGHKPDQALEATAEVISGIRTEFPEPDDSRSYLPNMTVNVGERWADYNYRAHNQNTLGLPLPWATLYRMTRGPQPGEAWSIVSRPNVGKTWAVIVIAVYLMQLGYRVLFASMETPPRSAKPRTERAKQRMGNAAEVARQRLTVRFDAIGARVSAWRFLNGALNPYELERYQTYLHNCQNPAQAPRLGGGFGWGELRLVSSPLVRTVGQLEQMTMEFEPDIVLWDSAYLAIGRAHGGRGRAKRSDQAGFFLEDVKHFLERAGVPGIITWHFNRDVSEVDTKASMNDIALTDDMPRLFDVIVALFRTPEMHDSGDALWRTLKVRDGVNLPELRTRFEVKRDIQFSEVSFSRTVTDEKKEGKKA